MTDLPENELFSAYLDGELTAAEQAEMDQLLAANPAARQLLDEFRTLSHTLQSLPQQKLGEDMSRQVLRVAERRMLTEGGPTKAQELPTPLHRVVFQRFLNRRNLVWLSLTGVVALMIVINEHREGAGPMSQMAREVARAPRLSGPPPTIQAAPDALAESSKESKSTVAKPTASMPPAASAPPFSHPMATAAPRSVVERPASAPSPEIAMKRIVAKDRAMGLGGNAAQANDADHKSDTGITVGAKLAGQAKRSELAKEAKPAEGVLVIHCGITPEAGQRALEKLLDANGLAWSVRKGQSPLAVRALAAAAARKAKQNDRGVRDAETAETLIDVEATPAQIEAIFAGLSAKPDVFVSVAVNPLRDGSSPEAAKRLADGSRALRSRAPGGKFEYTQRTQVAGSEAGRGTVGELDMTVNEEAAPSDKQEQSIRQGQKRQVLFVLHAVQGVHAAPAAKPPAPAATVPAKGK